MRSALSAEGALRALAKPGPPSVRREAAARLLAVARAGEAPGEWEEAARTLLSDGDAEVRRAGVALLALQPGPPEGLAARLAPALQDGSPSVRLEAVGQLADAASPALRPVLALALQDTAFLVRFEAARGLAAIRHPAGLDVLAEGLDTPSLRFRAIGALAELGDSRALVPLRRLFGRWLLNAFERTQAAGALALFGDTEGRAYLLSRLSRRRALDRPLAAELCGEAAVQAAEETLLAMLSDASDSARGAAARALGRLGSARAGPVLERLLQDVSVAEETRLDVAEGLVFLRGPQARGPLAAALASVPSAEGREELRALVEELE
ncbi:MAG: HEAT repeat domain-containing protein [Myxococcaceae bacterium]